MDEKFGPLTIPRPTIGARRLADALWPWRGRLAVAALLLLPLLVFLPAALLRGVFYVHDVQYYFYPYHALLAELMRNGELPLWNRYAFSGIPLLGDGQTALFYPPSWLFFALPGGAALNYDVLLQFSIAGAGMYLFARSRRLWRLPALVGAVAYMFCGFLTARVVHLSILSGAALLPLAFFCVERAFGRQATDDGRRTADDQAMGLGTSTLGPQWTRGFLPRRHEGTKGTRKLHLHASSLRVFVVNTIGVLTPNCTRDVGLAEGEAQQVPSPKPHGWFAAAAVVVGLQALAGHPQVPVYTALALGLYALFRAAERWRSSGDWRWLYRLPLRLAGIYLLGYGLAAIQLAPWIELGSLSPRAAGASFDFVFGGSMAGSNWLLLLFPYLYGSLRPGPYGTQAMDITMAVQTWEHSAYVGILPLALAAYALLGLYPRWNVQTFKRSNVRTLNSRWFSLCYFALLLVAALALAAGKHTPLAGLIYAAPVIGKLRDVERAMALAAFALAALAALGLQRLAERGERHEDVRRPALLAIASATVLLPLGVVLLAPQPWFRRAMLLSPQMAANLQLERLNAAVPLALALLAAALLLWWSRRPATPISQALAAGLVLLDMGSYAAAFNPIADPNLYSRRPDVLAALESDGAPFRKATFLPSNDLDNRTAQETLAVSWGMVYGVEDINGFNSLQPRRYTDYLFGPEVGDVSYGLLSDERLLQAESPILSALNVKYLLVPGNTHPHIGANYRQIYENAQVRVYENTQVYPRAFFAEAVRGEPDPRTVLRAVTADGFDGRRLALVESTEPPALRPATSAPADVLIAEMRANRIGLSTSTAEPRLLVLSEMYLPGWHARVDGVETPIYRTNYLFRGVVVPPGRHTVTFEYRPISVAIGAAISALALVILGWLLLRPIRRGGQRNSVAKEVIYHSG